MIRALFGYERTLSLTSTNYRYANGDGECENIFNEDRIELGLARTTTFSDACCREFERLREEAEVRGAGL